MNKIKLTYNSNTVRRELDQNVFRFVILDTSGSEAMFCSFVNLRIELLYFVLLGVVKTSTNYINLAFKTDGQYLFINAVGSSAPAASA